MNFKLDKLSTRVSKIQSDTQLRFSDLENGANNLSEKPLTQLPGSSKPQDFGAQSRLPNKEFTFRANN